MPPPPDRSIPADYHFHVYDYHQSGPWTLSPAQPSRNNLQFYSMVQDLNGLLEFGKTQGVPNIALTNVGNGVDSDGTERAIQALSFGGPRDLTHTPSALITGGIHAREWIASEVAYLLAEYLIKNYPREQDGPEFTVYQRDIKNLVDNRQIHILPMLNPNGNIYTVFSQDEGARMWRKNRRVLPSTTEDWVNALSHPPFKDAKSTPMGVAYRIPKYVGSPGPLVPPGEATFKLFQFTPLRKQGGQFTDRIGVDINRNFPTAAWGYYTTDEYDPKETSDGYFGTHPASESETRAVATYMRNIQNLGASIDYHSYALEILYPTEASDNHRLTTQYQNLGLLMQELTAYGLGTPIERIGYNGVGSLMDFASSFSGVLAFTIEMDPAQGVPGGFELPENQIQTVFEKNLRAALASISAAEGDWGGALRYSNWNVSHRGNRLPV